jgi:lipopolysaccharide export system ATP-binding protein
LRQMIVSWLNQIQNIFLDDLNITDYPMYKRAQQELDSAASVFRKLSIEDNI